MCGDERDGVLWLPPGRAFLQGRFMGNPTWVVLGRKSSEPVGARGCSRWLLERQMVSEVEEHNRARLAYSQDESIAVPRLSLVSLKAK